MSTPASFPGSILPLLAVPILALAAVAPPALAADPGERGRLEPTGVETIRLPLEKLMGYKGALRLEYARSEATVAVPVTLRMAVRTARLRLSMTNSIALVRRRSQLAVALNDEVVRQVPLDGARPAHAYDVALPIDGFRPSFNRLSFRVAQHYAIEECEDPFAPELWTEIDPRRSYVELQVAYRPIIPRLSDLDEVFGPKDPTPRRIAIMAAGAAADDDAALRAGALLAEGVALRLRHVPLEVTAPRPRVRRGSTSPLGGLDPASFGARDGILFGTRDQVLPFLGEAGADQITGPYLGIFPLPADPRRLVVVASGLDDEEVQQAATAFAFLDSPFPDANQAVLRDLALPDWPPYGGRNRVMPGKTYAFRELGFRTVTLDGQSRQHGTLRFSLPPDLWIRQEDRLALALHVTYGENLRENSVISVMVNDGFGESIPIPKERDRAASRFELMLPMRLFRPGENTLTVVPGFLPLGVGPCAPMPTHGLPMTLFEDSTLRVPDLPHYAEMPDLELFGRTGFPHTRWPDGREARLWVAGHDRDTIAAAWTLMGRLAQTTGMPLFKAQAAHDTPGAQDEVIAVGPRGALPKELIAAIDAQGVRHGDGLPAFHVDRPGESRSVIRFGSSGLRGDTVMASQFQSPHGPGRTATVFTADSARQLRAGMYGFVQPEAWAGLQGGRTYWDPVHKRIAWQRSDRSYALGDLTPFHRIAKIGGEHPLAAAGGAATLLLLLGLGLAMLLRRHMRRGSQERHATPKRPA